MNKNRLSKCMFILTITFLAQVPFAFPFEIQGQWEYSMIEEFSHNIDLYKYFNATSGYRERQKLYLNNSRFSDGLNAQSSRIYLGDEVNEDTIENSLSPIYNLEDCMDFRINSLIRMLYLNLNTSVLSSRIKDIICDALGKTKYWYDEPTYNTAIFYTENHQILYHTSELLVGQLFPNDTFTNNGKTGTWHFNHAKPLVKRWLDWRGQLGFTEWHSNTYLVEDIAALVNLVDFAPDPEIVYKAAMILDLIAFGFANNFFKNRYATSMGRCYDGSRVENSGDSIAGPAWIMLGLGTYNPCDMSNMASVALATSRHYAPPPILEDIAENASEHFEHWERNSIYLEEGPDYDIGYKGDELMYWWSMGAVLTPQTIEGTIELVEKHNIEPWTVLGPPGLIEFIKIHSFLQGKTLSEYSDDIEILSRGSAYETANVYTYRTPYYQLSGAQDHMKCMNSFQKHIWQASLSDDAYVFTNSPGGLTKDFDQIWMGGWNPRATLYKNVGVIQYDRETLPIEYEFFLTVLMLFTPNEPINHAFFPKNRFDEFYSEDNWFFGAEDNGYIALYSYEPTYWGSDYEIRVNGYKNLWIVELGSKEENGSFDKFKSEILDANIKITPLDLGYDVLYKSPSQGKITVGWDGPMKVDGRKIDLGDYPRFDNQYCYQEFGTKRTQIYHDGQYLELNFENSTRYYSN